MATISVSAYNDSAARTAGEAITITKGATWTAGVRFLSIEIKNLSLNFRREIVQVQMNIKASGVTN